MGSGVLSVLTSSSAEKPAVVIGEPLRIKIGIFLKIMVSSMSTPFIKNEYKKTQTFKKLNINKKNLLSLLLITTFLLAAIMIPSSTAGVEVNSGSEIIHVAASSIESITKFLEVGQEIKGRITASGEDNLITFRLFDPAGNPCMRLNVLQSTEFDWGPVDFEGEYVLIFDNLYPTSNSNEVNLEFQIVDNLDDSFQNTLILAIFSIIIVIGVLVAFLYRRHGFNKKEK